MAKLGKLIVIEGIDGSGKETQFELLVKKLQAVGVDFPRYRQSMMGRLLKELLVGKHGNFQGLTPYVSVLPFVIDQYLWWRDEGKKAIEEGKLVVANRYVTSNIHQIYKLQGRSRDIFGRWFWQLVYEELGLKQPDLVLVLDVPPAVSAKLISKKEKDKAEQDGKYQWAAYVGYKEMCNKHQDWVLVKCMEKNNLLTRGQIGDRMMQILQDEKFI